MKKIFYAVLFVILASNVCWADISTIVSSTGSVKSQFASGLGIGFYKTGSSEVGVMAWHPDFKFGYFGVGADINITLGDKKPAEIENFVVRYVEYDTGRMGIKYGVLANMTLAYGMLMNNYSTSIKGGSILNSSQTGVRAYFKNDRFGVEALGTKSNVYGARISEKILPMLVIGQSIAGDQVQSGYSLDAGIPLNDWSGFYSEWAHLNNHGSGFSAGFGAGQNFGIFSWNFKAERRLLDSNFVPGYFNEQHDIDPINMASVEASGVKKDGYLAGLSGKFLDLASAAITYENYNGGNPSLIGEVTAKYTDFFFYGNYSQPNFQDFRSLDFTQGAVIFSKLGYKVNPLTMLIANYKKAYDPALGRVIESNWYEVQLNF